MTICGLLLENLLVLLCRLPLAQTRLDILQEAFSSSARSNSLTNALILLGIVAMALAAAQLACYWYQRSTTRIIRSPDKLFHELRRAHRIPRSYGRILKQLARVRGVDDPCLLFVDPSLWIIDPSHDGQLLRSTRDRQKLQSLQRMLFFPNCSNDNQRSALR